MKILHAASLLPVLSTCLIAQSNPEVEPNDTPATASILVSGVQSFGEIPLPGGDIDYYTFTLTTPRDVRALTAPGFGAGLDLGDSKLTLFAPDGTTVLAFDDDFPGRGYYSQVTAGNLAPGTYYIKVEGYSTLDYGTYTLDFYTAPVGDLVASVPPLAPINEGAEPNDPRLGGGVATASVPYSRNLGNVAVGGSSFTLTSATADYDFYTFTVPAAGTYTISTESTALLPAAGRCGDTCLWVLDSASTVLASSDDFGTNAWSEVSLTLAPGTYQAVVAGYFTTSTGAYNLDIVGPTGSLPPVTIASFTAQTGGCAGTAGTPNLDTRIDYIWGYHSELPLLGTEFVVDVTGLPANSAVVHVLGFGTLPSPFDLGPLGAPGCFVEVNPLTTSLAFANANGVDFWSLNLPYSLTFAGVPMEMQAASLDAGANALGIAMTNRGSAVVGNGY